MVRFRKDSKTAESPFIVEVGIRATGGDLDFDESRVRLEVGGSSLPPGDVVRFEEKECIPFEYSPLLSNCRPRRIGPMRQPQTTRIPREVAKFFWLVFDRQPPPPETHFSVLLAGLRSGGQDLKPIRVNFSPGKKRHLDSAP